MVSPLLVFVGGALAGLFGGQLLFNRGEGFGTTIFIVIIAVVVILFLLLFFLR